MAIIISYPSASAVNLSDQLLGTQFSEENGRNSTKNFSVGEIVNLAVTTVTSNGASGTFETADLQLVTVVDGIITNIEPLG
jgi:exosome complex RNA-binding protein Rrp4